VAATVTRTDIFSPPSIDADGRTARISKSLAHTHTHTSGHCISIPRISPRPVRACSQPAMDVGVPAAVFGACWRACETGPSRTENQTLAVVVETAVCRPTISPLGSVPTRRWPGPRPLERRRRRGGGGGSLCVWAPGLSTTARGESVDGLQQLPNLPEAWSPDISIAKETSRAHRAAGTSTPPGSNQQMPPTTNEPNPLSTSGPPSPVPRREGGLEEGSVRQACPGPVTAVTRALWGRRWRGWW
jgi:hypothetical protein